MGKINASLKLRSFRLKQKGRSLSSSLLSALEGNHDAAALRVNPTQIWPRVGGAVVAWQGKGGEGQSYPFAFFLRGEREGEIGIAQ